ncbi:fasciclin domain-containing protein [Parapedobacter pyrenivorans]|nr:fasciclin domain-containing protein [Parapedobacter pyrenivorans]
MIKSIVLFIALATLFVSACSDDYFADGGILPENAGVFEGSTLEYLESHPETFDTLATLIRLCGLENAVNQEGNTFLAPKDYSIHNYFKLLFAEMDAWPASLSDIGADELTEIEQNIRNYIIPDRKIIRSDLKTSYSYVPTYGGGKARFNLVREDYLGNVNMGAQAIMFSLNMAEEGQKEHYQSVRVVVSDLQSANGVIQVLDSDTHIFGFN